MKLSIILFLFINTILSQEEYLVTIPATSYSDWIYFSITENAIVDIDNPESSLDWDLAFQRKHIKTNSGLSGSGLGGAFVDSVGTLDAGSYTWLDNWEAVNNLPDYEFTWLTDTTLYDFYDLTTHTFVEGIKNPALNAWGWFDNTYALIPTDYVMFVKCANGTDVVKFWAYDYYSNGFGGNVSFRYQTGIQLEAQCDYSPGDINYDDVLNVVDIVGLVNIILGNSSDEPCTADYNNDGIINVVDIVSLVNFILN